MTGQDNHNHRDQASRSIKIEGQIKSHSPVRKGSGLSTTATEDTNTTSKDSDTSSPASAVIDFPSHYRDQSSSSISEDKVCQITVSNVEDGEIGSSQQSTSETQEPFQPIHTAERKTTQSSHSEEVSPVDTFERRKFINQELEEERVHKEAQRQRLEQELALEKTVTVTQHNKQKPLSGKEEHIEEAPKRGGDNKEVVRWRPEQKPQKALLEEENRRKEFQRQQLLSQQRKQREVARAQTLRLKQEELERRQEADLKQRRHKQRQCAFPTGTQSIVIPKKAMESSAQYYNDQVHLAGAHGREHRQHIDHGRQEESNRNLHGRGAMNGSKRTGQNYRMDESAEDPSYSQQPLFLNNIADSYLHKTAANQNHELIELRRKCDDLERRLEAKTGKCTELENLLISKEQSHNACMKDLDNELKRSEKARHAIENKYTTMHARRFNNEKDLRQRSKATKRGKGKIGMSQGVQNIGFISRTNQGRELGHAAIGAKSPHDLIRSESSATSNQEKQVIKSISEFFGLM